MQKEKATIKYKEAFTRELGTIALRCSLAFTSRCRDVKAAFY